MRDSRESQKERIEDREAEEQVTVCMLQISSHLARHSEKHFDLLHLIFTPSLIAQLLSQVNHIRKLVPLHVIITRAISLSQLSWMTSCLLFLTSTICFFRFIFYFFSFSFLFFHFFFLFNSFYCYFSFLLFLVFICVEECISPG